MRRCAIFPLSDPRPSKTACLVAWRGPRGGPDLEGQICEKELTTQIFSLHTSGESANPDSQEDCTQGIAVAEIIDFADFSGTAEARLTRELLNAENAIAMLTKSLEDFAVSVRAFGEAFKAQPDIDEQARMIEAWQTAQAVLTQISKA